MADTRILDMNAIGKSFGGVPVLSDVHFHLDAGEVVALLGANGAGKSTLMKILSGNYSRDAGTITVNSEEHEIRTPADALALGIRMLPQELSIFPDLTVAENIMIAALPRNGMRVDYRLLESRAAALLKRMGLDWLSPKTRMGDLTHHVQRLVEIARAMNGEARILIMDEPTASLAADEVEMLFSTIRRLQSEGISIIYISHYLKEVFAIASRIAVLRDGRNAGDFVTEKTNVDEVLHAIVGNRVGDLYPAFSANEASLDVVSVKGLSVTGWLHGVDFTIRRGAITGVHGLIGSGIEMIGRALFGASAPMATAESVTIDGKPHQISTPGKAVEAGLGLVAAERKREGIIPMLSLRENMSVANMPLFTSGLTVDRRKEAETTGEWLRRLTIRARDIEQQIGTLSGGNQQKVCLARWLLGNLKVLILEEPTRGVDVGARQEIYRQIRNLADGGLGILLISSDAEEVAGLADRSIVLAEGYIAETFDQPTEASALMNAASKSAVAA